MSIDLDRMAAEARARLREFVNRAAAQHLRAIRAKTATHMASRRPNGHGLFSFVLTIALVSSVALALGWAGPALDAPADDPAAAVLDSREADAAQCRADHGPHSTAIHLPDGSHRCADKHGRRYRQTVAVAAAKGMTP